MPPSPQEPQQPLDPDHQLPAPRKKVGPVVSIIIILLLLILGALYFSREELRARANRNQAPFIPAGTTTIEITQ